jgi:NADPH-dependent 2,4-dienoyl-CoA reductase/sulfur reductase-like enzyme
MTARPRVVIVGGVAAGMAAASQARRTRPDADVVVIERGTHVSYAACGMPYNLADPARSMEDLVVLDAERARHERGIDVRTRVEALALDPARKILKVRDLATGIERALPYDSLVLATGAAPVRPPLRGIDRAGVFALRELSDGEALKRWLAAEKPRCAVVVGGGYVGLETAEALRARGLAVALLEKFPEVLPGFEPEVAARVHAELERAGVTVATGVEVAAIVPGDEPPASARLVVQTDRGLFPADAIVIAVGVRPNVSLARGAGIALGPSGAIAVDGACRTSAPDVFAAGDCAEAPHRVLGHNAWVPLGTTANKQGRVAGANAAGGYATFGGIVGTAAFKLFGLEVARTGLGRVEIERDGLDAVAAVSTQSSRGHAYPGGGPVTTVLFAERRSGRLLGGQMAGPEGVAKRIDVLATALQAGMDVTEVEALDLSYAPPFAPVYDPVLIAAAAARRALAAAAGARETHATRIKAHPRARHEEALG